MALAQVLTVVRELILDEREYPDEESARRKYLDKRYPQLSEAEREDLAKITPERLRLYTVSIFAGERNVILSKFPITFELIERASEKLGNDFDSYEFVREVHDRRPWRSAQIADLISNFAAYVREQRTDLLLAQPGLGEILTLEEMTFGVPRATNDSMTPQESLLLAEHEEASLEQILDMCGFIPAYAKAAAFEYRCPELFRYRREHDRLPDGEIPEPGRCFGIVSRTAEYGIRWSSVSEEMFNAFSAMQRSMIFNLGLLAEEFLSASPAGRPEAESAKLFLVDLVLLNSNGAVLIPREDAR